MSVVFSVDPGGDCCGWAKWVDGVLVACGLSRTKLKDFRARAQHHRAFLASLGAYEPGVVVVCEVGTWRGAKAKKKMSPKQLGEFNTICGHLGHVWVQPDEWKGGTSREVEQPRTRAALAPAELALLDAVKPTGLAHNACSAVGIGLFKAGRAHGPQGAPCLTVKSRTTRSSKPRRKPSATARTSRSRTSPAKNRKSGSTSRRKSSTTTSFWNMSEALLP